MLNFRGRQAFTTIELVIVIVIMGILASIAVTKLSATREDAQISQKAQQIATAVREISMASVSGANIDGNFSAYSDVIKKMIQNGHAVEHSNPNDYNVTMKIGNVEDCVTLRITSDSKEDNLTLVFGQSSMNDICYGVQEILGKISYSIPLRGNGVKF